MPKSCRTRSWPTAIARPRTCATSSAQVTEDVDDIERRYAKPAPTPPPTARIEPPAPANEPAEAALLDKPILVPGEAVRWYEEGADRDPAPAGGSRAERALRGDRCGSWRARRRCGSRSRRGQRPRRAGARRAGPGGHWECPEARFGLRQRERRRAYENRLRAPGARLQGCVRPSVRADGLRPNAPG